jgi:hypothetical protein
MKIDLIGSAKDGSWPIVGSIEVGGTGTPSGVLIVNTGDSSKYFTLQDAGGDWQYVESTVVDLVSEDINWACPQSFWLR